MNENFTGMTCNAVSNPSAASLSHSDSLTEQLAKAAAEQMKHLADLGYKDVSHIYFSSCFCVRKDDNGKWGLADSSGKLLVPCEMDAFYDDYSDGIICFRHDGKMGLYIPATETLLDRAFDSIVPSDDEMLHVSRDGVEGFITHDGQFFSEAEYDDLAPEVYQQLCFIWK